MVDAFSKKEITQKAVLEPTTPLKKTEQNKILKTSEKNYSITIGIPTKNRAKKVTNCLMALKDQTFRDFNVIVVDGSRGDATKDVCLQFSKKLDITYIKSLKLGVSKARKTISENCQSELLLLIDDDICLFNDCISNILEHYSNLENRDNNIVAGQYKSFGKVIMPFKLTAQGGGFPVESSSEADYFFGALLLIPKNIYKKVSWTERFVSWGFEEVLFCLICKRCRVKLAWINKLLATHTSEQRNRPPVDIEANRAYTMLFKHVFVEPSIINLLTLESVGFVRFLIANSIRCLLSPKKLVLYVFSYIYAWNKGHFWFLKDLSRLKSPE